MTSGAPDRVRDIPWINSCCEGPGEPALIWKRHGDSTCAVKQIRESVRVRCPPVLPPRPRCPYTQTVTHAVRQMYAGPAFLPRPLKSQGVAIVIPLECVRTYAARHGSRGPTKPAVARLRHGKSRKATFPRDSSVSSRESIGTLLAVVIRCRFRQIHMRLLIRCSNASLPELQNIMIGTGGTEGGVLACGNPRTIILPQRPPPFLALVVISFVAWPATPCDDAV